MPREEVLRVRVDREFKDHVEAMADRGFGMSVSQLMRQALVETCQAKAEKLMRDQWDYDRGDWNADTLQFYLDSGFTEPTARELIQKDHDQLNELFVYFFNQAHADQLLPDGVYIGWKIEKGRNRKFAYRRDEAGEMIEVESYLTDGEE